MGALRSAECSNIRAFHFTACDIVRACLLADPAWLAYRLFWAGHACLAGPAWLAYFVGVACLLDFFLAWPSWLFLAWHSLLSSCLLPWLSGLCLACLRLTTALHCFWMNVCSQASCRQKSRSGSVAGLQGGSLLRNL